MCQHEFENLVHFLIKETEARRHVERRQESATSGHEGVCSLYRVPESRLHSPYYSDLYNDVMHMTSLTLLDQIIL